MTGVVVGLLLIISASFFVQFPDLAKSLKENDEVQWKLLGSPAIYGFSKALSVFSWVINRGLEKSPSTEIIELGQIAFKKALIIKCTLIVGLVLLLLSSAWALINQMY